MSPDPPSFNLSRIDACRVRLAGVIGAYLGLVLEPPAFAGFVQDIRRKLPAGVVGDAVFESVRYLAGQQVTAVEQSRLSLRLAGNIPQLLAGQSVHPWHGQREDEFVPITVLRVFPARNKKGLVGYEARLFIMAGTCVGLVANAFWSKGLCRALAIRAGFSRWGDKFRYTDPADLVGLRLRGQVDARYSATSPSIRQLDCPFVDWNRKNVLTVRCRKQPCPRGWTHSCRHCAVGYEECPAAVHFRTFHTAHCLGCNDQQAVFDPETSTDTCLKCTIAAIYQKGVT